MPVFCYSKNMHPARRERPVIAILNQDCRDWMRAQSAGLVDCVVTSPPYNLGITYQSYEDKLPRDRYLAWLGDVFDDLHRVLRPDGHFFLNVGYSNTDPWVDVDVLLVARKRFVLQNRICWVKSVSIDTETFGHFKPISSGRYVTPTHEMVFHLTKTGDVPIDRSAVGVPYKWKSNLDKRSRMRGRLAKKFGYAGWLDFEARAPKRERERLDRELDARVKRLGVVNDRRCRGNSWFLPYDTIRDRDSDRGSHPATFPVALPEMCIRLAGCPAGSLVFDPFVGSGTTMIAARAAGMLGVGTDIDRRYVAHALKRLQQAATGNVSEPAGVRRRAVR